MLTSLWHPFIIECLSSPPGDFDRWLDRKVTEQPSIDLLRPYPAEEMEAFEVSRDVGNVRNNSPEVLNSNEGSSHRRPISSSFLHQTAESRRKTVAPSAILPRSTNYGRSWRRLRSILGNSHTTFEICRSDCRWRSLYKTENSTPSLVDIR